MTDMPLPEFFIEKMIQLIAARQPEKYDTSKPCAAAFWVGCGIDQLIISSRVIIRVTTPFRP